VRVGPQAHKVRDFSTGAKWMHRLGFITNAELSAVYGGAAAFICPSTYEGFGLPVLEAMQAGAPVICADASSLSEVAGSAALYFAPADEDGLIAAIEQLLGDSTRRNALVAAGKMRAAEFRWRNTALATLAAFDEACAAGRVA
jgi:alpha-1,3-rhamnosyl/mannosyltransferase